MFLRYKNNFDRPYWDLYNSKDIEPQPLGKKDTFKPLIDTSKCPRCGWHFEIEDKLKCSNCKEQWILNKNLGRLIINYNTKK